MSSVWRIGLCISIALLTAIGTRHANAQAPATAPAVQPGNSELVTMDFPADGVEVSLLADIVTQRLHIPILYDETVRGRKVVIRVPTKVPESALMGILQSALRIKQMALVDAEQPGWKQIILAPNLAAVATPAGGAGGEGAIAQVFTLQHSDPMRIVEVIRPFTTQPGGYVQAQQGQKSLIVCDYASVVKRVEQLIHSLDAEAPPVEVRFVKLKEAEATQLVPAATQMITNRETYQWGSPALSGIFLSADERLNQVVVVAPPARMTEIQELITGMDKAPELKTKVYRLKSVSPDRVDRLIKTLIGESLAKRAYQAAVDHESQSLIVSATPDVLARLDDMLKELDVPISEAQNPIQFYKLKNTKASDVLGTISGLLGDAGPEGFRTQKGGAGEGAPASASSPGSSGSTGMGTLSTTTSGPGTSGLSLSPSIGGPGTGTSPFSEGGGRSSFPTGVTIGNSSDTQYVSPALSFSNTGGGAAPQGGVLSVRSRNATVAADVNTNTIIVIAPPSVQQMYADLIKRLDERRPQVQIECTIVTLNTSDNFTFGVDIGKLGGFDTSKILTLSSFGISSASAATGHLTPAANIGGTFALLSPRIADIVLSALQNNARARFVSAPQLLVNDNGKGKLESVQQEPFAVILDASSTQSITSLGGTAQAGTSISVEPHISEADYLQLGYSIELSNFTGTASNGLPPPSQKNAVDSSVTIPDGYTIVVGGLTTKDFSTSVRSIPFLGDIPILKYLFGNRSRNNVDSTLFVFIKPIILRDDKFEDLKYLSGKRIAIAGIPGDYPRSEPVPMR
jgi:type II secretory pathway component GspD/PulD (secretin)